GQHAALPRGAGVPRQTDLDRSHTRPVNPGAAAACREYQYPYPCRPQIGAPPWNEFIIPVTSGNLPSYAPFGQPRAAVPTQAGHGKAEFALTLFQLQLGLVFLDERLKIGRRAQQTRPLFVVECHRKAPQSVHADAPLLADPKFHGAASLFGLYLFFQFLQFRFQLLISWFSQECTSQ